MKKVHGIIWKVNVNTAQGIVSACNSKYATFGVLVKVVNRYLAMLEHVNKKEDDWLDADCIFCLELLTSGLIEMTLCGHMLHRLCLSNHCQVHSIDQSQASSPMCRSNVMTLCCVYP
jgi:hypothetical protein